MKNPKKLLALALSCLLCLTFLASCKNEDGGGITVSRVTSDVSDENSHKEPSEDKNDSPQEQTEEISEELSENSNEESNEESKEESKEELRDAPDVPPELTKSPMTVTKVNDSFYRIESELENKDVLELTFTEKPWSTFNLGAWTLVDGKSGGRTSFVHGSTDWEYVYRAGETRASWDWSGGNHGKEQIVSLKFYDGITDREIKFRTGTPVKTENLVIVENTRLHWGDISNSFADVTRKYTVVGTQIKLNVDYKYTKDCYNWLSYTCMFPIDKKYGLYCDMIDENGKVINTITTKKIGAGDYSGPMNDKNAAVRAYIYGYADDRYAFDVRVTTKETSTENFKNDFKTAFWDMNTTENKLYFSKYDKDIPTKVEAGTELSTECVWNFIMNEK